MAPTTVSATEAKVHFGTVLEKVKSGTPVIVEKNQTPQMVMVSMDDYEDFLELKDRNFQKGVEKDFRVMKKGRFGTLDGLYKMHRKSVEKEAKKNKH